MVFPSGEKREFLIISIIIAIIGLFYVSTIRYGHDWGDDFAMYICHAKNIVQGISYSNTGYIYNPDLPNLGPKMYPIIFPLMLSPVYKLYGLNIEAMKIEIVFIFLAFSLVFFILFRDDLPFHYRAIMVAVIGFNPIFWEFKESIISDIPFLFWGYLSLFYVQKAYRSDRLRINNPLYAVWLGLLVYIVYATRTVGIILIPSIIIVSVIKDRKLTPFVVILFITFAFLMLLQNIFLHNEGNYLASLLKYFNATVFKQIILYIMEFSIFWENGVSGLLQGVIILLLTVLAIVGYAAKIKSRDKISIIEIFLLLYLIVMFIWPVYQGLRFMLPIVPLYVFYAFAGLRRLSHLGGYKIEKPALILLSVLILLSYYIRYKHTDFGPIRIGITKKETVGLFNYIRNNTGEKDVFIFRKPRVLALLTERSASAYHMPSTDEELWSYFKKINAKYVVVGARVFGRDRDFLAPFIERNAAKFQEVYSNPDFKVYLILREINRSFDLSSSES